jgi:flagellar hook assembly protein FlgD
MHVRIGVYDVLGRRVKILTEAAWEPGYHSAVWDGRSASGNMVASGVYFIRLEAAGEAKTTQVTVAR